MIWQDDPSKDYRKRYQLPEHWLLDDDSPLALDYVGYVDAAISLISPAASGAKTRTPIALDAGCGDGYLSKQLVGRGYEVVGVDYSPRAVAFARIFVEGATFNCLDLRELKQHPEFEKRFDCVVAIEVIEHIPMEYQLQVCQNLAWALTDSGQLVISVPSIHLRPSKMHYKHFRHEEICDLLRQAGLSPERTIYQRRIAWVCSRPLWKLCRNRFYDLVIVRRALKWLFLKRYNIGQNGDKVGRYIIACRKTRPAGTGMG